jgi:S-adenosylmethionine-diacylglycerol 3-amino-3-carboxypropyl transferase
LNYSLGDEDSAVEHALLADNPDHVMAVAGGGGRNVPLLARAPARLTLIDILPEQLHLTRLRLEALRAWELPVYQGFLGYPPEPMTPRDRRAHFEQLLLPAETRDYLNRAFTKAGWEPIAYMGKFEQTLIKLSKVVRLFTGKRGAGIFECADLDQQQRYYHDCFPHWAWRLVVLLLGNSTVLNSLLYRGEFPKKNVPGSAFGIYNRIFKRLLHDLPARRSFFLQLVFFGRIRYPEGNPIECDPKLYAAARRALTTAKVTISQDDVVVAADPSVDVVYLSDVPSFFNADRERSFMRDLHGRLREGAVVAYRGHLRIPHPDLTGFEPLTAPIAAALREERTQLWQYFAYRKTGEEPAR